MPPKRGKCYEPWLFHYSNHVLHAVWTVNFRLFGSMIEFKEIELMSRTQRATRGSKLQEMGLRTMVHRLDELSHELAAKKENGCSSISAEISEKGVLVGRKRHPCLTWGAMYMSSTSSLDRSGPWDWKGRRHHNTSAKTTATPPVFPSRRF